MKIKNPISKNKRTETPFPFENIACIGEQSEQNKCKQREKEGKKSERHRVHHRVPDLDFLIWSQAASYNLQNHHRPCLKHVVSKNKAE